MISIKSNRNNLKTFVFIDDATHKVRKELRDALTEVGKENVRFTKSLIKNPPKSGRTYFINGRRHRASAPGQPPANMTGRLLKSIGYRTYGWERMEFGDKVFYGKFLELGTRKMQPREHLKRTVRVKERDNYQSIAGAVKKAMR